MDINTLVSLVGNVGFPIVVAGYLLWQSGEQQKAHKEESDGFIKAIDNNTNMINILIGKLEKMEDKLDE